MKQRAFYNVWAEVWLPSRGIRAVHGAETYRAERVRIFTSVEDAELFIFAYASDWHDAHPVYGMIESEAVYVITDDRDLADALATSESQEPSGARYYARDACGLCGVPIAPNEEFCEPCFEKHLAGEDYAGEQRGREQGK